jgi:hypothetical protein
MPMEYLGPEIDIRIYQGCLDNKRLTVLRQLVCALLDAIKMWIFNAGV